MSFSFGTALSGLRANSTALSVTGNNIANANTIGFRSGSVTFSDVFADSQGIRFNGAGTAMQTGLGVRVGSIHSNFIQGGLTETGASTNAAIQGNGFFVVRDGGGTQNYTRAGDFVLNNDGNLVMPSGQIVQGYQAVNGVIPSGATLTDIQVPIGQTIAPAVTTEAMVRMNLDSGGATGSDFHATVRVFDSRGAARSLDLTFTRQANGSYNMSSTLDGVAAQSNGGATVNFTFDANGLPTAPTALQIVPDQTQLGGAVLPTIDIALRQTNPDGTPGPFNITNYANPSAVSATDQDGASAGEFSGLTADNNGLLYAVFSNRQSRVVGQYALATFNSQEGLSRLGDNLFGETVTSGQASIGTPGSGGRGGIVGSALEQSNVDIATEFVNLIEAQRGFQANSRVITTMNEAFQQLIQAI